MPGSNSFITTIHGQIIGRINVIIAYFSLIYFFEIIYSMLALNVLYGSVLSLIAGLVLALALSVHIVFFYFRKNVNRIVQIVIMELHIAYSLPFVVRYLSGDAGFYQLTIAFVIYKLIMCAVEVVLIWFLTDEAVIEQYR